MRVMLAPNIRIFQASELRAQLSQVLVEVLQTDEKIDLDGGDVCQVDSAAVQVLVAFVREAKRRNIVVS
ncbi:MAG: STAS domain-containing protein [Nannocystaceae bacterium]